MSTARLGKKLGMTQIFDEVGHCIPVTVIEAGPCVVVQKRTEAKNKYSAIQIGFGEIQARKLTKPERGVFERRDLATLRHLREVRLTPEEVDKYQVGDRITFQGHIFQQPAIDQHVVVVDDVATGHFD